MTKPIPSAGPIGREQLRSNQWRIGPVDPAEQGWERLDELAPYVGVYVTNRNHSRAAAEFRSRYDAPVRIDVELSHSRTREPGAPVSESP